ncbi:MAG: hypothetical protein ABMA15_17555 [Vicinamibacterales bacterium]
MVTLQFSPRQDGASDANTLLLTIARGATRDRAPYAIAALVGTCHRAAAGRGASAVQNVSSGK